MVHLKFFLFDYVLVKLVQNLDATYHYSLSSQRPEKSWENAGIGEGQGIKKSGR